MKIVVVLGATPKTDRYGYIAMQRLKELGHHVVPVNPAFEEVLGERCYPGISDVPGSIDTITLYLGAARSTPLIDEILRAQPRRIIFNPGAENEDLQRAAQAAGIEAVNACTLVMLSTGTF